MMEIVMLLRQIMLIRNKKSKESVLEITNLFISDGRIRNKNRVIYPLPVMDCDDDYSAPCQPCMEKSSNNRRQEAIIS
jgi:hypothetical protein